jgi:hypothetical protein
MKYPDEYKSIKGKANIQMISYYYAQFHSLSIKSNSDITIELFL